MAFPPEVAEKALVACGRSCCLCHKFCGPKMELHHIIQKADGGEDTFENCIPLCFDCHADQKSYDFRHPKGRKYTPTELRSHRDKWYQKTQTSPSFHAANEQAREEKTNAQRKPAKVQIFAIQDGHQLLAALTGVHAFGQQIDQAENEEEADLIATLLDMVEVTEIWDDIMPGDRYRHGHQVSGMLEKLEARNWGICVAHETKTVKIASQEMPNWTTATLRMSKLDPQLIEDFRRELESHGINMSPQKNCDDKSG